MYQIRRNDGKKNGRVKKKRKGVGKGGVGKESTTGEVNFAMGESRKAAGGRQKRKKWKKKRVYGLQTVINMDETRSRRFVGTTGYGGDPAETSTRIVYCLVYCVLEYPYFVSLGQFPDYTDGWTISYHRNRQLIPEE